MKQELIEVKKMVKMTVEEPKEIVVHHLYKVTVEELVKTSLYEFQGKLPMWSKGIVFLYDRIPPARSGNLQKAYLAGQEHWDELHYAEMEKYCKEYELDESEFRGNKLRIIDVSRFRFFDQVVDWLKTLPSAENDHI